MRAITVVPGQAGSARLAIDDPSRPRRPARCSSTVWRSGSAGPTPRSCAASTAGRRAARSGSCWGTSRSGACSRPPTAPDWPRATSWSGSCDGRTRCRAAPACAGEWDFCANGEYSERGIKQRDGYGSERWRVEPEFAIRLYADLEDVGVLLEPTSVVAKAWEQIDPDRVRARRCCAPHRAEDRRRADRVAGGATGRGARLRGARAGPGHRRAQARARARPRRHLPRGRRERRRPVRPRGGGDRRRPR